MSSKRRSLEDKVSHVEVCAEGDVACRESAGFERYRFEHQPLPEIDLAEVDTSTTVFGRELSAPLLIAPMSGGVSPGRELTYALARTAQQHRIALGLGSQRISLERPELADGFSVRHLAPDILLFANLGAVNLNTGLDAESCRRAVLMAGADALMLHANPLQEAIQGGDTRFSGLLAKIGQVCQALAKEQIPVVVREVGFGMPGDLAAALRDAGVRGIDTGGRGGTSWAQVEGLVSGDAIRRRAGETFRDWGLSTCESLVSLDGLDLEYRSATGGVRTGVDVAKAIGLGADLAGLALPFLRAFRSRGEAGTDELARALLFELRLAMFSSGAKDLGHLAENLRLGG